MKLSMSMNGAYGITDCRDRKTIRVSIYKKDGQEIPSEVYFPSSEIENIVGRLYSIGFTIKDYKTKKGAVNHCKRTLKKYT